MDKSESIHEKPLFPKREGFRLIFIIAILLMAAGTVLAQTRGSEDYNIEAAFLSNFGKFVQWPQNSFASQSAPIIIGVYGEDPFHDSLKDIVRSRTINGHPVIVQPVPFNKLQYCQVLFICPSERKNLPDIIRKLNGACVLTVTENINPFQSGVMINFVRKGNEVRFEINDAAARRVGLKISSKLLSLATKTTISRETSKTTGPSLRSISITRKLMAIMLVSTATALLLVAAAILTHAFFSNRAALVQDLFTQAEVVGNNSTGALSFGDYEAAHEELTAFEEKPNILAACLYTKDDDGQYNVFTNYYAPSQAHFALPAHPDHGGIAVKNGSYILNHGKLTLFYYFRSNDTPGAICIIADMTGMSASLWHYGLLIGAFTLVSLLATFVLASRLQRVISRPIFHLAQTAKVVSTQKNYAVRAIKESDDELGNLIDVFNKMLSQIQEHDDALHKANDELEQRVRERTRDLEQQFGRISLLNQITHAVAARQDFESIVSIVLQQLEEHLPVDYGSTYWLDEHSETLKVLARGPRSQPIADALKIPDSIPLDHTPFRPCLSGETVYVPDGSKHDLAMAKKMSGAGFNSCVATPLVIENKVIGLTVLLRRGTDAFSRPERDFIRGLCAHVALAIHQAQLYQDLQKAYNDLRQSQQAVMQQERLKALGQMASGVAHDINNALSPVVGFSDLIAQTERGLSEAGKKYLQFIKTAGEDIAHIVKRLREFYRPRNEKESLQSLNLRVIAKQVIDMMQPRWRDIPQIHGINIEMKTDFDAETPEFAGIESEIREALTNLLLNAIDALPKGGTITVRSRRVEYPARESKISTYAALEVSDTGVGMDEPTQKRCLEPFFSTKGKRGTGLGLAMVYGVIERHDGKIEIESQPGEGTTMRLLFAARPLAMSPNTEPPESDEPPPPLHILCIDDEPALRTLVHDILENDGHTIEMADGGQAGIKAFQEATQRKDPFDVVITDLGMPMVDGHAVARAVKGQSSKTPVIMLTGWGAFFKGDGDVPTEVDGILSKPPRLREIRSMLRRVTCNKKWNGNNI